jgi:hypothetical protein
MFHISFVDMFKISNIPNFTCLALCFILSSNLFAHIHTQNNVADKTFHIFEKKKKDCIFSKHQYHTKLQGPSVLNGMNNAPASEGGSL